MKIEVSDKLLEEYKKIVERNGLIAPSTDKEWSDKIDNLLNQRIDFLLELRWETKK